MSGSTLFCRLPSHWLADPSLCWFEWQGLVAGLLALCAALIGAGLLWVQITGADKRHSKALERRHNAVRAAIPIALASISKYCGGVAANIVQAIDDRREDFDAALHAELDGRARQPHLAAVEFPGGILTTLQEFIETLTCHANVKHMAELISSLQILHARYESFDLKKAAIDLQLYGRLIDVAKVQMLTDAIYNYGRFVDEENFSKLTEANHETSWNEILTKAHSFVFGHPTPDVFFPTMSSLVDGYKKGKVSPWNEKFA